MAAVCELGGAVLLGTTVTKTVANGIARAAKFETAPELLMFGRQATTASPPFPTLASAQQAAALLCLRAPPTCQLIPDPLVP